MSKLKTDISENTTPISFKDTVSMDSLKNSSSHPSNSYGVFVNSATGELYAAETSSGSGSGGGSSTLVPYNQCMDANVTSYDGELACDDPVALEPAGRVDVFINGHSEGVGLNKACYFSGDGGTTARARGDVELGDKLYWNGSIAGYELDANDRIDFDYLTATTTGDDSPKVYVQISGGPWAFYPAGSHIFDPTLYEEPPLESWTHFMDANNYLKLFVSESATDLINACQIAVDGVVETYTVLNPIGGITENDKKVIDALFKTYVVNGLTIILTRGSNWPSFTLP
jgi:hypothetical protein